jgi:hypothetical protein
MGELTGEGREGEGEGSCGRDWGVPGGIVGGGGGLGLGCSMLSPCP